MSNFTLDVTSSSERLWVREMNDVYSELIGETVITDLEFSSRHVEITSVEKRVVVCMCADRDKPGRHDLSQTAPRNRNARTWIEHPGVDERCRDIQGRRYLELDEHRKHDIDEVCRSIVEGEHTRKSRSGGLRLENIERVIERHHRGGGGEMSDLSAKHRCRKINRALGAFAYPVIREDDDPVIGWHGDIYRQGNALCQTSALQRRRRCNRVVLCERRRVGGHESTIDRCNRKMSGRPGDRRVAREGPLRSAPVDSSEIRIRRANDNDADNVLDVCGSALGWNNAEFDRALFRWKHFENAFGESIILVAEDSSGLVAVRPFMQWRFVDPVRHDAAVVVKAARAVDTATRPEAQGRGLFRQLTETGLDALREQEFGFVFNTPNDQSRPGYLKMGWETAGRVGFGFAIRSTRSLPKVLRSRTAAQKPSIATPDLGVDVTEGLSMIRSEEVLSPQPTQHRVVLRTAHTLKSLHWRFAQGPLAYRWLPTGPGEGCIVRLRERGPSRELLVALVLGTSEAAAWDVVKDAMQQVSADYCLTPAGFGSSRVISRLGPTLALRDLNISPTADAFAWSPGDIEVF